MAAANLLADTGGLEDRERKILERRWIEDGRHYEAVSRNQRLGYYLLRVPAIIGSATVPVLASLDASTIPTAVVGLVVAVLTALDAFFKYGVRWQQQRSAAVWLRSEGWQFLELSGDYEGKSRSEAYKFFIGRLERAHAATELSYLDVFAPTPQDGEKRGR